MYHYYKPHEKTIVSTTPALKDGQYTKVDVALPGKGTYAPPKIVSVDVLPVGRKSLDNKPIGSIGLKRTFEGDDQHANKQPSRPLSSITNTHVQEMERIAAPRPVELSLAQRLNREAANEQVGEDSADHRHALRHRPDLVDELLRPAGQYSQSHRPDTIELSVARRIIEREASNSQNSLTDVRTNLGSVKVPAPSTSVFAFGAEVHRQQMIQKEATLQQKISSLPGSNVVASQNLPVRAVSSIGKIGSRPTTSSSSSLVAGSSRPTVESVVPKSVATYGMKPQSRNTLQTDGLKLVGNALVNTKAILANAPTASRPGSSSSSSGSGGSSGKTNGNLVAQILAHNDSSTSSNNVHKVPSVVAQQRAVAREAATAKETQLDSTIAALLNRKSINASDADNEWFEAYSERMNKLAQKEYAQEKASSVHSVTIKAFQCCTCVPSLITEEMPQLCRQKGHNVVSVSTVKQFFECGSCGRKDFTLGRGSVKVSLPPDRRCGMCGSTHWIATGRYGSGPLSVTAKDMRQGMGELQGGRLILSASEWASRKDVVDMAAKTSSL